MGRENDGIYCDGCDRCMEDDAKPHNAAGVFLCATCIEVEAHNSAVEARVKHKEYCDNIAKARTKMNKSLGSL